MAVVAAPVGTVTLLFTDIEGSTRLLRESGDGYAELLLTHRRLLREAFSAHGGYEVDTEGDAFFVAFASAGEAVAAAEAAQRALAAHGWPDDHRVWVRIGIHTGEPRLLDGNYIGLDVHHAARVMAAGHGGQVLITQATRDLLNEEISLRDLGEHRLKDLSQPQRLYQLQIEGLPGEFPALKSLHQTNLPVQPNELIGRGRELKEVDALLGDGARLLTLSGPGGAGKTRLALHVAAQRADDHPDGVWFVPLAPLTDPTLVPAAVGAALGIGDGVIPQLRGKRLLIVLDNFEHLRSAAAFVADLLAAAPAVQILVTSRERLGLASEREYVVPPLTESEGVSLFVERAGRLKPGFRADEAVHGIVARLEGLPLAVELAAARVKVMTPAQILGRLTRSLDVLTSGWAEAPARQRTLRATIEWSYELLEDRDRRAFEALAVFAGGFTLEAAEAVCGDLDSVASLVDKSLLRRAESGRFFMLETIREFAAELLERSPHAEDVADRHAAHYFELIREHGLVMPDPYDFERGAIVAAELPNVRVFLTRLQACARGAELVEAVGRMWLTWFIRGLFLDLDSWCQIALRTEGAPVWRGIVLAGVSNGAVKRGEYARALETARAACALFRCHGSPALLAGAQRDMSNALAMLGDLDAAETAIAESAASARAAGDEYQMLGAESNLVHIVLLRRDFPRALRLATSACSKAAQQESPYQLALAEHNRGIALAELGRLAEAEASFVSALDRVAASGFVEGVAFPLDSLAVVAARHGAWRRAARFFGAVAAIQETTGLVFDEIQRSFRASSLDDARAALGDAEFEHEFEAGRQAPTGDIVGEVLSA